MMDVFYQLAHRWGWLCDLTYALARPVTRIRRVIHVKLTDMFPVSKEELYRYRDVGYMHSLTIGVTNICNAKCSFCAYPQVAGTEDLRAATMPFAMFKDVLGQWISMGHDRIDLTSTVGDPLVDSGLMEKIHYAREAGIKMISFTTNGILLNKTDASGQPLYRRLIDGGVTEMYVSTEGTDPKLYKEIYGVDRYEAVISGIENLLKYNKEKGEPCYILIRFRNAERPSRILKSADFRRAILPYLSSRMRFNFTVDFDNWGGRITEAHLSPGMHMRSSAGTTSRQPCASLFGGTIQANGDYRMCGCRFKKTDRDALRLGSVLGGQLKAQSESDEAWKVVQAFYDGKRPESCQGCTFYQPITRAWLRGRASKRPWSKLLSGTERPVEQAPRRPPEEALVRQ